MLKRNFETTILLTRDITKEEKNLGNKDGKREEGRTEGKEKRRNRGKEEKEDNCTSPILHSEPHSSVVVTNVLCNTAMPITVH